MTVSTELSHEEYVGNGVTTDFDFRFRIFESRHLIVVVADNDGNETTLKNGTDYFIVGVGSYFGGKVVLSKPLAKDWKILLERDLPVVQETDLRNQGKFFAEVHEDAFDYLTMLIQKALGTFSLSLRKPTYLSNYYDAKGNRITNLASPKIGGDATNKDYVDNSIKDIDSKTLRVKDKAIPALPSAEQRRNKQLGFDNEGYPQLLDPVETGALGYVLVDSFEKGAVLTSRYQALHFEYQGEYFRWDGDLPKSVPPHSTPYSSGGIGKGAWVYIGENTEELEERLLGVGSVLFKGSNRHYIQNGDEIPLGTNVVTHSINGKPEYFKIWGEAFFPATITSISDNEVNGVYLYTDKGVVEIVTLDAYSLRTGGLPTSKPEPYVEGWGAKSGNDSTKAFKYAIEFARKFNTCIRSRSGEFFISERLFFGPKSEADLNTSDGFPINVCLGYIGDNITNTKLIPTSKLAGDIVIDMTGLREKYLKNFSIEVNSAIDCPAVGILTARFNRPIINSVSNNDWGEFDAVKVAKFFSVTPYLAACTEEIYVKNCNFRTDHNDAKGAFISTSNLQIIFPTIKEAKETGLKFTVGNISNLHQTHMNCDYYVGSINPSFNKIGMIYIYNSLMVNIISPFFNNNAKNIDAVVVDKDPDTAFVYGIHVQNANCHQTVRSGMRLIASNTSCSFQSSNRTGDFEVGALIVEGYTNGFFSNWLDGDLVVNAGFANSQINSCRNLIWNEKSSIEGSYIGVRGDVKTDPTNRVATNNFQLNVKGILSRIVGFFGSPVDSSLNVQSNRTNMPSVVSSTEYQSFNSDLFRAQANTNSSFRYLNCVRNGVEEIQLNRGGDINLNVQGAGVCQMDTSGVKRRLVFNSDGTVSATKI